ncbi:alpha/beta fold hydrolase [Mobilicoccus sp.]|uniref:alpha/beta fold hydrolase n=1 Tax=Mobilicoccus sp. TaxID=2034349 RepID=UPI0028A97D34|nr:alpha/beta fold hydrolase [Mobilicoccus sp.]
MIATDVDRARALRERLVSFPGLDAAWSRLVDAVDADGVERTWHLLDTHADRDASDVHGVLLCVHGNPTWSYLWRRLLAEPPAGWRVVAVDQLGMGFSDHPRGSLSSPRTLQQRITDLAGLTEVLDLGPRVVAAGHDWGGMVATGWALEHRAQLAGLVLANTTVWHDFDEGLPLALRFAITAPTLRAGTVDTPAFVRGTTAISSPRPPRRVRDAYAAPYGSRAEREFVGQFVADIPTEEGDPTRATMAGLAAGLVALGQEVDPVPALLLRGPKDPVFSEEHLRDLRRRLPHADVHRYEGASHLVVEDAPRAAADIATWITARVDGEVPHADDPAAAPRPTGSDLAVGTSVRPWAGLTRMAREKPGALCVAEIHDGETTSSVTFGELEEAVEHVALGLRDAGVRPGDRVGLLVEPGIDLSTAVYACWRAGAVIVVADAGLGIGGMGRALRGAGTDHVVAMPKALPALPLMRVPGRRIVAGDVSTGVRCALSVDSSMGELRERGRALQAAGAVMPEVLTGDSDAAVLYTSGATGPSKGVVYTVDQIRAQVGGFGHIYGLRPGGRLVAAFAPFALYGPALGVAGIAPDMKVTAPATLTAAALADAVRIAEATTVFASPAALRNVLRNGGDVTSAQREALGRIEVLMSAGAPVPASLLRALRDDLMPRAEMHTPYGMSECLPVSDITLEEIESLTGPDEGVCVGRPIVGVSLAVAPLPADHDGEDGPLTSDAGVVGEICVRAPHMLDRYDQLWATTHAAERHPLGWHRTGDVGHLDADGRLWVEGRRVHVVHTPQGPVTPVGLEQRVEALPQVASAAVVGVGPVGVQQIVVVVTLEGEATGGEESADGVTAGATAGATGPGGVLRLGALRSLASHVAAARSAPRVLADDDLASAVRESTDLPVAAVLVRTSMPVDIRHQSKIDRAELADWAAEILSGRIER